MEEKVYLRVGTPRSMKDPATRSMVFKMALCTFGLIAVTVMNFTMGMEYAKTFAVFFVLWLFIGAIPLCFIVFNSYVYVTDGELICNMIGFYEKHYAIAELEQVKQVKDRLVVYAKGKELVSMPDNEAARELVSKLHLACEL